MLSVKKELTAAVGEDWAVRVQRSVSAVSLKQLLRASAVNVRSSVASQGQRSHRGLKGHVASIEPSANSVRYTANKARQTFAGPAPAELVTSTSWWNTTVCYELVQYTQTHPWVYTSSICILCFPQQALVPASTAAQLLVLLSNVFKRSQVTFLSRVLEQIITKGTIQNLKALWEVAALSTSPCRPKYRDSSNSGERYSEEKRLQLQKNPTSVNSFAKNTH